MIKYFAKSFLFTFFSFFIFSSHASAATITVNPGESIQAKCLKVVNPGDVCIVNPGTYNEALILERSGTSSQPITIKCANPKECVVDSSANESIGLSASKTVKSKDGKNIQAYIVDGFKLISDINQGYTVDFQGNWVEDLKAKEGGNNYFTLKNCYVEGAVNIYGHHNLVESCELNGKSTYSNGLNERFGVSHDNTYRNNTIYGYKMRGVWSMQYTDNILIEGNHIYNTGTVGGEGVAIDCDAAANNQSRCFVKKNRIHDIKGQGAILFENCFNCSAEENIIYNVREGIGIINYGPISNTDPSGYTEDGIEYRNTNTNTIFKNNLIYDTTLDGITCFGSPGGTSINNTIHKTNSARSYFGGIVLTQFGGYSCPNWVIKNNIISQPSASSIFFETSNKGSGVANTSSNYNLFHHLATAKKFSYKTVNGETAYSLSQWQSLGYDQNSKITDPLDPIFVSPSTGDFHLLPNSPACSAGEGSTYVGAFPCTSISPSPKLVVGDATGEGDVNLFDYSVLVNNYNKSTTNGFVDADFNLDQKVDGQDYVLWLNSYK